MQSDSQYPVRRLVVFGGYNHPEPGPTWNRAVRQEAPRPVQLRDESVVRLDAIIRPVELDRAA